MTGSTTAAGRLRPTRLAVPRPPAADPLEVFSDDEVAACAGYAKPRQRWTLLASATDVAALALLALTVPGRALVAGAAGWAGGWAAGQVALAAVAVVAVEALVGLPFSVRNYRQDRRGGLATQGPSGFARDWLKARAVGLVLLVLPVSALVLAARWRPAGYPWSAAAAAAALVLALGLLGPLLLEPIFNRFTPLPPGRLRGRVLSLSRRMGVPLRDVLVADASRRTTRINAYVSGLGRTRRVVLYDTFLDGGRLEPGAEDQVVVVLAHELAHVRHRDVLWGTGGMALLAAGGVLAADRLLALDAVRGWLAVDGLGDPLVAPGLVLLAVLGGLLLGPLAGAVSRWSEARADWAALEATGDPESAVAVERRLALANRADLRPSRLMVALVATHPPTMARVAQARLWARTRAVGS